MAHHRAQLPSEALCCVILGTLYCFLKKYLNKYSEMIAFIKFVRVHMFLSLF